MIYYKKKIQQDVGATAIEYGILSALIAVVTILGLQETGKNLGTTYCTIANKLSQTVGAGATASGCSANSSGSGSSGSSGTSAGSSGTNADGSGSDSSATASTKPQYDATNSYTISAANMIHDNLTDMLSQFPNGTNGTITSITGIYDSNGNPITTPKEWATAIGISDTTYQNMLDIYKGIDPKTGKQYTTEYTDDPASVQVEAENNINNTSLAEVQKSGKPIYIPKLQDVNFKTSDGQTLTYAYGNHYSDNINMQLWEPKGNQSSYIEMALINPTKD